MTLHILLLLLLAAIFHAVWNILLKYCNDSETASWLQLVCASIFLLPMFLYCYDGIPLRALPTLLLSGGLQAGYYLFLSRCYKNGNLSVVYPLARGSAPLFVCMFSFLLGTERLSLPTVLSLCLIVFGIYLVNMPSLSIHDLSAPFRTIIQDASTRISLLIGVIIAIYTIADKQNVAYVHPLIVYYIVVFLPALLLAPYIIKKHQIKTELSRNGWLRILIISIFTFLAYYLVLLTMQKTDASYVSSIREISVLFVVIFASVKSRDRNWLPKVAGACIIFTGILLTSIFS